MCNQEGGNLEVQTTSGENAFTFKAGLSKDRRPDINVTTLDSGTYLVSPKGNLAAGEYLLSTVSTPRYVLRNSCTHAAGIFFARAE